MAPRTERLFAPAAILLVAAAALSAQKSSPPDGVSDEGVRRAWSTLLDDERKEVVEWLRLEVTALDTFQLRLLRWVLEGEERDPGFWPEAQEPPVFDPEEHAPGQPIARKPLARDHSAARRMRARVFAARRERRIARAWTYDWGSGEPRRSAGERDPERVFANALVGFPPDLDLAEALVLASLDRGEERRALGAFAHAYTDRRGRVYPGITLYDAWASGAEIEMPDVDTLGIVHTVLDERRRWKAPVPSTRHRELYAAIGDVFSDARHYRGLREALAAAFLIGEPVLGDGYAESLVRFHALWDRHDSSPRRLAPVLPTAARWKDFLASWIETTQRTPRLLETGRRRRELLIHDAAVIRSTLVSVLRRFGAFDRKRKPRSAGPRRSGGR